MSIGERIRQRMSDLNIKAKDVVAFTGASKGTVSNWVNEISEPSGDYLIKLSKCLKSSPEWISSGDDKHFNTQSKQSFNLNVIKSIELQSYVPIISWVHAGSWKESDLECLDENTEYIPCHVPHSSNTYALRVQGESMQSSSGKSYPDGMIIIVDGNQRSPEFGRRIIARLIDTNSVTFKQLASDGTRAYLKPLNSNYPPMFEEFEIIGTVIGAYQPE